MGEWQLSLKTKAWIGENLLKTSFWLLPEPHCKPFATTVYKMKLLVILSSVNFLH
jgi:hypothetical protein